jgi:hypothetical protein
VTITLGALLESVRDNLDDPYPGRFKDAQLVRWTNEGVRDIARRVHWFRTSGTVAAVAGTQTYTGPATALVINDIKYVATGETREYPMDKVDARNARRSIGPLIASSRGTPRIYWAGGYPGALTFSVSPIPSAAGTFTVYFYGIPARLTIGHGDLTDAIAIPEGYESAIVHYVTYSALASAMSPSWTKWKQDYELAVAGLEEIVDSDWSDQADEYLSDVVPWHPLAMFGSDVDW